MKHNSLKSLSTKALVPTFLMVAMMGDAMAGGSGSNVSSLFQQILTVLQGCSVVVVTCAIIWAGYKVLFQGSALREVAGPLLGAILIGAAPWIADLLVG